MPFTRRHSTIDQYFLPLEVLACINAIFLLTLVCYQYVQLYINLAICQQIRGNIVVYLHDKYSMYNFRAKKQLYLIVIEENFCGELTG